MVAVEEVREPEINEKVEVAEITTLPIDHPGAHDPAYRRRRDFIASLARQYREHPERGIPNVGYTAEETEVWRYVSRQLTEVQQRRACSFYLDAKRKLGISADEIPQLSDLSAKLTGFTGFRLAPIEGLVETRAFLSQLEKRTMLCTQYVRHHSRPDYTPDPTSSTKPSATFRPLPTRTSPSSRGWLAMARASPMHSSWKNSDGSIGSRSSSA